MTRIYKFILPLSALAFFCLGLKKDLGYCLGLFVMLFAIIFAMRKGLEYKTIREDSTQQKVFYLLSAIGICLANQNFFYEQTLKLMLPEKYNVFFGGISIVGSIAATPFVYICVAYFWKKLSKLMIEGKVFEGIKRIEFVCYLIMFGLIIGYVTYAFLISDAFYGTEFNYDIIYTSDSPVLVSRNVYMAFSHPENDIRQPLFALFAAPFTSIAYLVSRVLLLPASGQALFLNYVQIVLLFVANFMLSKLMKLSSYKRICFMCLSFSTYASLLFVLMMEQYIVAYFWLMLFIYLICEKRQRDSFVFYAAGGTMLTSMICIPFMSDKSPVKNFKEWFVEMVKCGLGFVAVMLLFCRFDVFFNLASSITFIGSNTGASLSFAEQFFQYTAFIRNYFMAPAAGVDLTTVGHASWQLYPITNINLTGIVILVLVFISAILNREKKSSMIALGWVCFSVIMLCVLGWGTKENGLILYSLYFGWAFLVLLFQLIEKLESLLKLNFIVPLVCAIGVIVMLGVNCTAIRELFEFAVMHFPI